MKRITISVYLVIIAIVCPTLLSAQHAEFGVRFMPTFSQFDVQTSDGGTVAGTVTLGYGGGIFLGYTFNDFIGIQGEIIYSSINQKYKEFDVEQKINLKYVNIPLLLTLNTGKASPVNFGVVAGPQIGISVGSSFDNLVVGYAKS